MKSGTGSGHHEVCDLEAPTTSTHHPRPAPGRSPDSNPKAPTASQPGTLSIAAAVVLAACVPAAPPGPTPVSPPAEQENWLTVVNEYRSDANLPGVVENPTWSAGDYLHAEYTVRTGMIGHTEDPASPFYTAAGALEASRSDVAAGGSTFTDRQFIEEWMSAPFHAVGVLDPTLTTVGYGSYRSLNTPFGGAAALDVISGRTGSPAPQPVLYPGDGATVHLTTLTQETPDELTACPGYSYPAGLPILVQLPAGESVTASTITLGGVPQQHCQFDGTSYTNPDPTAQALGRSVLGARNATVLIPSQVLVSGNTYTVSVTTTLPRTITWSFSVN